ncbi:hypothetical protein EP7_002558 [Isosphaeraceae bacterium EP7]
MPDFRALLRSIAGRLSLSFGECSVLAESDDLNGCCHALSDLGHMETPFDGWMRRVE